MLNASVLCRSFINRSLASRSRSCGFAAFGTLGTSDVPELWSKYNYSSISETDITTFESIVGATNVLQSPDDVQKFNRDWMGLFQGHSKVVLLPRSTDEVAAILKHCTARRLPVVPQGGNTGLVGGSVPINDEVVISMQKLNKIISFDEQTGILTCDAGCILENLETFVHGKGFTMPIDLGAKGSCHIGGCVSTNAGGIRFVRFGSLHGNVLGLEAVTADGRIVRNMCGLPKDNTGYDLKQLFIGSEGTLGIVTKVMIKTPAAFLHNRVVIFSCEKFRDILDLCAAARRKIGPSLSAFEFFDVPSLSLVLYAQAKRGHVTDHPPLVPGRINMYALMEACGNEESELESRIDSFCEYAAEKKLFVDGIVASSETQAKEFWFFREGISPSLNEHGKVLKYDISLPQEKMYEFVESIRSKVLQRAKLSRQSISPEGISNAFTVGYAHVADCNLHLNILVPHSNPKCEALFEDLKQNVEPSIYNLVSQMNGSISAEHGIGRMKKNEIYRAKDETYLDLMRQVKHVFDPSHILNPGKVFP